MHPRISELLQYLEAQRQSLHETVNGIDGALWHVRPASDRWSVSGVLEHLAIVERRIAGLVEAKVAEGRQTVIGEETESSPVLPMPALDRVFDRTAKIVASEASQPKANLDPQAALSALTDSRQRFTASVMSGDGLALGKLTAPHPIFGPFNLYQWIAFVGAHEARHTAQIREIAQSLS